MITSVVVPLDGSRLAESAIPTARWLARSAHGRLHFLHVRAGSKETAAATTEYLDRAAAAAASENGPSVDYEVVDEPLVAALRKPPPSGDANLVVIATRGQGDLGPLGRRSVAECLATPPSCPVLIVKPCPGSDLPCLPVAFERVLVAVDPNTTSAPLGAGLADFLSLNQAHATLVAVVPLTPHDPRTEASLRRHALARLDRLGDRLKAQGGRVAARAVAGADVPETIMAEAARVKADVIALRPRVNHAEPQLIGRTTERIIRLATTPVLVLPPDLASA